MGVDVHGTGAVARLKIFRYLHEAELFAHAIWFITHADAFTRLALVVAALIYCAFVDEPCAVAGTFVVVETVAVILLFTFTGIGFFVDNAWSHAIATLSGFTLSYLRYQNVVVVVLAGAVLPFHTRIWIVRLASSGGRFWFTMTLDDGCVPVHVQRTWSRYVESKGLNASIIPI